MKSRLRICLMVTINKTLGFFLLLSTLFFVFGLGNLDSVFEKHNLPHYIAVASVIVFSGFGFSFFAYLMTRKLPHRALMSLLLLFNCVFLPVVFFLTVSPGASSCKCVSFQDMIMNVKDWSQVELAVIQLVLALVLTLSLKKRQKKKYQEVV